MLVEEGDDDEQKVDWSIVDHFEDERLYLVANVGNGIDFLSYIQLRHALFVFFCFPDDDFHGLFGHIHVVEDQIAVCEDKRETHYDPAKDEEAEIVQEDGECSCDKSCLED